MLAGQASRSCNQHHARLCVRPEGKNEARAGRMCNWSWGCEEKRRGALREFDAVVIIEDVPHATGIGAVSFGCESRHNQREANSPRSLRTAGSETWPGSSGVERSPEKAGVGGSIPSLATTFSIFLLLFSPPSSPTLSDGLRNIRSIVERTKLLSSRANRKYLRTLSCP